MMSIRPMTCADIPLGMRLKQQAGWNQTEADWQRFLDLEPSGCFVAEFDSLPAATLTTCLFGPVAWVAMVLVDEALRGRGIGNALMRHALAFLDSRGVRSVRLDATALGQPLYEKLAFSAEYSLSRFEGVLPPHEVEPRVTPARPEQLPALLQLDQAATGTDREKLLCRLFAEDPGALRLVESSGQVAGYLAVRPGSRAVQLGPCIAGGGAGPLLLADASHRHAGQPVYLDVPADNPDANDTARSLGLSVQRRFVRMCRGPRVAGAVMSLWASSGPEKG